MRPVLAGILSFALSLALAGVLGDSIRLGFWEEIGRVSILLLLVVRGGRAGTKSGFVHGLGELWAWLIFAPLPWSLWFLLERFAAVTFHAVLGFTAGWCLARRHRLPLALLPLLHSAANAVAALGIR